MKSKQRKYHHVWKIDKENTITFFMKLNDWNIHKLLFLILILISQSYSHYIVKICFRLKLWFLSIGIWARYLYLSLLSIFSQLNQIIGLMNIISPVHCLLHEAVDRITDSFKMYYSKMHNRFWSSLVTEECSSLYMRLDIF